MNTYMFLNHLTDYLGKLPQDSALTPAQLIDIIHTCVEVTEMETMLNNLDEDFDYIPPDLGDKE